MMDTLLLKIQNMTKSNRRLAMLIRANDRKIAKDIKDIDDEQRVEKLAEEHGDAKAVADQVFLEIGKIREIFELDMKSENDVQELLRRLIDDVRSDEKIEHKLEKQFSHIKDQQLKERVIKVLKDLSKKMDEHANKFTDTLIWIYRIIRWDQRREEFHKFRDRVHGSIFGKEGMTERNAAQLIGDVNHFVDASDNLATAMHKLAKSAKSKKETDVDAILNEIESNAKIIWERLDHVLTETKNVIRMAVFYYFKALDAENGITEGLVPKLKDMKYPESYIKNFSSRISALDSIVHSKLMKTFRISKKEKKQGRKL